MSTENNSRNCDGGKSLNEIQCQEKDLNSNQSKENNPVKNQNQKKAITIIENKNENSLNESLDQAKVINSSQNQEKNFYDNHNLEKDLDNNQSENQAKICNDNQSENQAKICNDNQSENQAKICNDSQNQVQICNNNQNQVQICNDSKNQVQISGDNQNEANVNNDNWNQENSFNISPGWVKVSNDICNKKENSNKDLNLVDFEDETLFIEKLNNFIINKCKKDITEPLTKITETIYMGQGRTTLYGEMLTMLGISHVLSVGRTPHRSTKEGNFSKLEINNFPDNDSSNIIPYLPICFDFINTVYREKGKVYIHCEMGCSRSAVVVIAILRFFGHVSTLQDAYNLVKKKRCWINVRKSFRDQVKHFFSEPLVCYKF